MSRACTVVKTPATSCGSSVALPTDGQKWKLYPPPAFTDTVAALEGSEASHCVNARSILLRCLLFPLYPTLGKRDVETTCKVLATLP